MTKTSLFFSIHQENTCKSSLHLSLIILIDFHCFAVNEYKLQYQSIRRFLLRSRYAILVKIWKLLKLLNSFPFIKKIRPKNSSRKVSQSNQIQWYDMIYKCKSCLQLNLIILTDFHSFVLKEDKFQNLVTFQDHC